MGELNWRKARASASNGGCVEVADRNGTLLVRDTKDHGRGQIHAFTAEEWQRFVDGLKAGQPGRLRDDDGPRNFRYSRGPSPCHAYAISGQVWVSCSHASCSIRSSTASSGVRRSGASWSFS